MLQEMTLCEKFLGTASQHDLADTEELVKCLLCSAAKIKHTLSFECTICYERHSMEDRVVLGGDNCVCCRQCLAASVEAQHSKVLFSNSQLFLCTCGKHSLTDELL